MNLFSRLLGAVFPKQVTAVKDGINELAIYDRGDAMILKVNGITYSTLSKNSVYTGSYWDYFIPLPYVFQNAKVLLIGFGGGTIPYQYHRLFGAKVRVESIETSEKMVELSKKFLPRGFHPSVTVGDGAEAVEKARGAYDIIILDAYRSFQIPEQFFSGEFIADACMALKPGGLLAINLVENFTNLGFLSNSLPLLKSRFSVYKVRLPISFENSVVICAKGLDRQAIIRKIAEKMPATPQNRKILGAYRNMRDL